MFLIIEEIVIPKCLFYLHKPSESRIGHNHLFIIAEHSNVPAFHLKVNENNPLLSFSITLCYVKRECNSEVDNLYKLAVKIS